MTETDINPFAGAPGRADEQLQRPKTYVWQSLLMLLFCFPLAIVGILFASRVENRWAAGDVQGACRASGRAQKWCWAAFGVGMVWILLIVASFAADPGLVHSLVDYLRGLL